jgi:hypothetical protein
MAKKKRAKKPLKKKRPVKKPLKKKPARKRSALSFAAPASTHPPKTCTLVVRADHPYYPVYWNATDGCYRCPRCGGILQ